MNGRQEVGALLDGLALIAAMEREDRGAVEAMLAAYSGEHNDSDRGALVGALLAHSVSILRAASHVADVEPAKILGAVAASLATA